MPLLCPLLLVMSLLDQSIGLSNEEKQPMIRRRIMVYLAYQAILLIWCFKIHHYCFEFTIPDGIGLAITSLFPLVLIPLSASYRVKYVWTVLFILPFIVFPLINHLRSYYSETWILLHIFLLTAGVILLISNHRLLFSSLAGGLGVWLMPYGFLEYQHLYYDKLESSLQTRMGRIDKVVWKGDQWIYHNGNLVLSTADGHMYAETMVHPLMPFYKEAEVLLIGGDHGFTLKELDKYSCKTTHVPYDHEWHPSGFESLSIFLTSNNHQYDIIIIDLPDPEQPFFQEYYTSGFYQVMFRMLKKEGSMITNAGSLHSGRKTNETIRNRLKHHNWHLTELQAQIPTLGHRSWIIASKKMIEWEEYKLKATTKWLNEEAMEMMLAKGKEDYPF